MKKYFFYLFSILLVSGNTFAVSLVDGIRTSFYEGSSNHIHYFKLSLNRSYAVDISVTYKTQDGTALAGSDYIATSNVAVIPAGETSILIPVEIIGDTGIETDETFSLVISKPIGVIFPQGQTEIVATYTILNDDVKKRMNETDSNHTHYFLLEIPHPRTIDVSVDYQTRDGTAIAGEDYATTSGVASIIAGETKTLIGIEILGDTKIEEDETFSLVISNPIGGSFTAGVTEIVSTHTLLNDDFLIREPTRAVSNETYYKYLWHIDSKNSSEQQIVEEISTATNREIVLDNIDPNADINILEAWKITKGKGVKVAVIDDGADVNHEDLKANIFLAYNVDGQTDDVSIPADSITDASHGNSCAGFIASPINGKGIVGVAPESKLIIIRQEEAADSATIEAFEYAKDNGAKVISCSWGTDAVSEAVVAELKSLYDAGITVVFASGNEGNDLDEAGLEDESEVPWVIGVGASSELNDVTEYSNYGLNIDVIAPGGNHSTSIGLLALDDSGTQGSTKNYSSVSNNYAFTDGTSFSAPIVAGVVALMYSVNPDITPKEVRDILISTADKVGGDKADYWDGFDQQRAYGKINAFKAVQEAQK